MLHKWSPWVSDEVAVVKVIKCPFGRITFLAVFFGFDSLIIMCFSADLFELSPYGICWTCWCIINFHQILEFLAIISSSVLSLPSSSLLAFLLFTCWHSWCVPPITLNPFTYLQLFSYLSLKLFNLNQFTSHLLILYFVSSSLLLSSASEVFISIIVLFNRRIAMRFLLIT